MIYQIEYNENVEKDVKDISDRNLAMILKKIEALSTDPYPPNCKKLKGYTDTYRIRAGKYRILYQVEADVLVVLIIEIGHRKDVYQ